MSKLKGFLRRLARYDANASERESPHEDASPGRAART
jgi:hypothetical protein